MENKIVTKRKIQTCSCLKRLSPARWLRALALTVGLLAPGLAFGQMDIRVQFGVDRYSPMVDWPMLVEPSLTMQQAVIIFPDRLKPIMLEAMKRPDVETRRHAIESIADAYVRGMKEMKTVAPVLLTKLAAKDLHPVERLTTVRALVQLEYVEAAPEFVRLNETGEPQLIFETDRALAAWKTGGIEKTWIERIANARTPRAIRNSAIECAGIAQVTAAVPELLKIALDRAGDPAFRMAAARAAGQAQREGLESSALALLDATSPAPSTFERTLGVTLLRWHKGPKPEAILLRMASDSEFAVASLAAERLVEIDPLLLTPVSAKLSNSPDVGIRMSAVKSLAAQKSPIATSTLCPLMNDPAPQIRYYVRDQIIQLDKIETLRERVRDGSMKVLSGSDWRGLECAAFVLGKLDHKPAIDRFMELKTHARDEVRLAAVTAIRWLAIPETLPKLLAYVKDLSDNAPELTLKAAGNGKESEAAQIKIREIARHDIEIAQIMQFFGAAKFKEAEPTLKKFIPKKSMPFNWGRASAIWALGQLHIDDPVEELGSAFLARYNDTLDIMNPESGEVRHMSLIAMGYMKYRNLVNSVMIKLKEDNSSLIAGAGRWAVKRVNGKELPEPPVAEDLQGGWFIQPHQRIAPPAPASK